jgi:hypothetical protein
MSSGIVAYMPPQVATSASIRTSRNPTLVHHAVVFVVSVRPAPSAGTITFFDGTHPIAGCVAIPPRAGAARCRAVYPGTGHHRIHATFSGDAIERPSSTTALLELVT